jgi:hypothetical protein
MRFRIWDNDGMDRLRSLFGHAASIPWLLFLWSAAEILERVEFISNKMHDAREFIMTPNGAVVLLIISVAWLTMIPAWPTIRARFPTLRFQTIHERVHAMESVVNTHTEVHNGFQQRIKRCEDRHNKFGEWVQRLDILEQAAATKETVQQLAQRIDGAISWLERVRVIERLDTIEGRLSATETGRNASVAVSDRTIEMLPAYFKHQDCIGSLKARIERAIDDFLALQETYGSSAPATLPFSDWRPKPGIMSSDPAIQTGERFAQSLEVYTQQAQSYAIRWGRDVFSGVLFVLVSSWKHPPTNDVSGDQLLAFLREHYTSLEKIQTDYAVLWSKEVKGSATIS